MRNLYAPFNPGNGFDQCTATRVGTDPEDRRIRTEVKENDHDEEAQPHRGSCSLRDYHHGHGARDRDRRCGTAVDGTLTVNDVTQPFTASAVTSPAGMYTSAMGDARASWVVRPDQSMVGMENKMSRRDGELIGQLLVGQQDFQDQVREMRIDRQLEPAPTMTYGTWHVDMNGTPMTATPVTGSTTF
jgi:hypothetical protein